MKHTIIILLSLTLYSSITIAGLNPAEKRIILDDIKNISKEKIIDTNKVNNEYWGNGLWSSAIHYAAEKLRIEGEAAALITDRWYRTPNDATLKYSNKNLIIFGITSGVSDINNTLYFCDKKGKCLSAILSSEEKIKQFDVSSEAILHCDKIFYKENVIATNCKSLNKNEILKQYKTDLLNTTSKGEKLSEWMENEVANAIGIVAQMNRQQKNTCANTKDIPCWRSFWKNTPTKPWLDLYNTLRRPDVKDRLSKFNIYIK